MYQLKLPIRLRFATAREQQPTIAARRRKLEPQPQDLGGVGVDEVEALAHEGLFVVEDHAAEVDEALGVDEDADRGRVGGVVASMSLGEGVDAVALAGLGVELML